MFNAIMYETLMKERSNKLKC